MRANLLFFALLVCCTNVGHAAADAANAAITGVFSDMTYNSEGDDVLGTEIFIVYSKNGYFVVFQSSEGVPSVPVVVKATVVGTRIRFLLPSKVDPRGEFNGTVMKEELVGSFKQNDQTVHLKRRNSYWQK